MPEPGAKWGKIDEIANFLEVFTVPLVFRTDSAQTPHGLLGLFGLSADTTQTGHGIFLAGHPANFKFLVLVQSADSPSKVLVKS